MPRRHASTVLLLCLLAAACVPAPAPSSATPAQGAATAVAAFPPAGAKWRVRVTERGLFRETIQEVDIQAEPATFDGRTGYGMRTATGTTVLDPASFNTMGTTANGLVTTRLSPPEGPFFWPLWTGKSWTNAYTASDLVFGQVWTQAHSKARVGGFEPVTVPAGTFQAFRIEYSGGIGTSAWGTRDQQGNLGIETEEVHWYAPALKLVVKSTVRRAASHHEGVGLTTIELVRPPG